MFSKILKHKDSIINALSKDISNVDEFKLGCEYILREKISMFDIPEFNDRFYEDEDEQINLILPAFRRAWGKIYTKPPTLFKEERLILFQAHFNIDEFLEYLIDMIVSTKGCLSNFKYIDKTAEHLQLIVDNYISMLVDRVLKSTDIKSDLRDAKLKNIL